MFCREHERAKFYFKKEGFEPSDDPQISKSLKWNGAITEDDTVVPPEPQTLPTQSLQEAEPKEDANQETAPSLEASRVPKRTRSHSADSRA